MDRKYKVGGYVKLAKLWERSKDAAVAYHSSYYAEKFRDDADKRLVGVYIDITGNKEIYKRPEMVHLLQDCKKGIVNLIFSQTRAYLAANTCDFCFLLKYLFDIPMRVDVVTDDDDQRIDTILDVDNQRQSLKELAEKYTSIREKEYLAWKARLEHEMEKADPAHPIGVYFETENIYTLNPSSQYSLDIQALLADWESGNKSRRMILSYDQRIMTGQYLVADLMGYRHTKDSGRKPKNECGKGCYSCPWESDLYLCFAEERSEVYCDYSVHR